MIEPPAGYVSLREAVIRTAEAIEPGCGVREYLLRPPVINPMFHPRWSTRWHDPFQFYARRADEAVWSEADQGAAEIAEKDSAPRVSDSAWTALERARARLREALGSGQVGALLESSADDEPRPTASGWWRRNQGFHAMRSGWSEPLEGERVSVFVDEAALQRWWRSLAVDLDRKDRPAQGEVDQWVAEQLRLGSKREEIIAVGPATTINDSGLVPKVEQIRDYFSRNPGKRGRPKSHG